jgi:ribonuclease BN (tRNA processing enzyme)
MRLTILGSGSFLPNKKRNSSGYLLEIGDDTILLDGGSGTIRQIARAERSVLEIDRVFYSHFHLDHIADFLPLLFTRKYYKPERPTKSLVVQAHPNFVFYFDNLTRIFEKWTADPEFPTVFQPLQPGEYLFTSYKVEVFTSNHTPESLMYRFLESNGKSMLYTGDVDMSDELRQASRDVDLLLIECGNLSDSAMPGHLNPGQINELIRISHPRKVVLTHLPPEIDQINIKQKFDPEFADRIIVAEDLMVITI